MIRAVALSDKDRIIPLLRSFPPESRGVLQTEFEFARSRVGQVEGWAKTTDSNDIVGYIVTRLWGGVYHIDTLVVSPCSRGKGIGRSLIEFAKARCIAINVPQLNVCTFNEKCVPFYESLGFKVMGKLQGPFAPLHKDRIFLKWVNPSYKGDVNYVTTC